jgi:hypothetical protein
VEATVSEFKRKMSNGKLKIRGGFKIPLRGTISTGIGINFGRIVRYLDALARKEALVASTS